MSSGLVVLCYMDASLLKVNVDDYHSAGVENFFFASSSTTILNHPPGIYSSMVNDNAGCFTSRSSSLMAFAFISLA